MMRESTVFNLAHLYQQYSIEARIILSTLVGSVIGAEREIRGKAAGIRTFAILCLTSCLLTTMSVNAPGIHDSTRVVGQIISGVGFLCGAVIWKKDNSSIEGLTTAASLFCISGIGIAIGYGFEYFAIFSAVIVFIVMELLGWFVRLVKNYRKS
jgi:putative Mg2+ transporter-C (MgtC) family protein